MTYEEYEAKINAGVTNIDTLPAVLKEILIELKTDLTNSTTLAAKVTEQEARIKDLQATNMKLFLGQTGKPQEQTEPDKDYTEMSGLDAVNAYMESIKANGITTVDEVKEDKKL